MYIAGWLAVVFLARRFARSPWPDTLRAEGTSQAYRDAGLVEEKTKAFDQLLDFKAWVSFLEWSRGRSGAPTEVRHQLFRVTVSILAVGWATKQVP